MVKTGEDEHGLQITKATSTLASYADVLRLVTRSSPGSWGGTRDKPKNVCVGGYVHTYSDFLIQNYIFLSGYGFRPHSDSESDSESGHF